MQSSEYKNRLHLYSRDALKSVIALAIIVLAWWLLGFGLAKSDITFFGIPLWVIGGTLGTWVTAIIAAVVLGHLFNKEDAAIKNAFEDEDCGDASSDNNHTLGA